VGQNGMKWEGMGQRDIPHTTVKNKIFYNNSIYIDNMHETLFALILSGTLLGGIFFYMHGLIVKIKNIIIKKKEKPPLEWTD
jgi:hypothetical protein